MRTLVLVFALSIAAFASDAPKISADLGNCTADFRITGADGKPIYNARVHTLIKYGAFGMRKTELEVRTDSNGEASVINLPNFAKKPLTFDLSNGGATATVEFSPDKQCHAKYDVALK